MVVTRGELLEKAKSLATPIDLDALVAQGLLEKKGSRYKVVDMRSLPEHVADKIVELSSDGFVKFSVATKSAETLVKKLAK